MATLGPTGPRMKLSEAGALLFPTWSMARTVMKIRPLGNAATLAKTKYEYEFGIVPSTSIGKVV